MRTSLLTQTWLWSPTKRARIVALVVLTMALAMILWRLSIPSANAAEQLPAGSAAATALESGWVVQISNSLAIYTTNYPASNFAAYQSRLSEVKAALDRGNRKAVKTEMNAFFKMLNTRSEGISEVAADELSNFAQMVTPVQEYGISVPRSGAGQYGKETASASGQ